MNAMIEMDMLSEMLSKYPKREKHFAISGLIPFDEFVANEGNIRARMRQLGYRSVYRGPREKKEGMFGILDEGGVET